MLSGGAATSEHRIEVRWRSGRGIHNAHAGEAARHRGRESSGSLGRLVSDRWHLLMRRAQDFLCGCRGRH